MTYPKPFRRIFAVLSTSFDLLDVMKIRSVRRQHPAATSAYRLTTVPREYPSTAAMVASVKPRSWLCHISWFYVLLLSSWREAG